MAIPQSLTVACPLCGQESTVKFLGTQAIVSLDAETGLGAVSIVMLTDTPQHYCPAVPSGKQPTAAKKPTAKRTVAKKT